jgi:hypothetical protein
LDKAAAVVLLQHQVQAALVVKVYQAAAVEPLEALMAAQVGWVYLQVAVAVRQEIQITQAAQVAQAGFLQVARAH